jgi:Flp pilus assembly protein CpaB
VPLDPLSLLVVRARRTLVRSTARRALAGLVALVTGLTVVWQVRAADAARRRWSDTRPVAVAQHDLEAGDLVSPGDVEVRDLPTTAVAETALEAAPVGVVVRHPIAAGEPLVDERLGREGLTGVAALLPEGHRAVSIAVGPMGMPAAQLGDAVDVVAVLPTDADLHGHGSGDGLDQADGHSEAEQTEETAPPAIVLVERALVVDVTDQAVTVAVPEADATRVAYAAVQGIAVLMLAGG